MTRRLRRCESIPLNRPTVAIGIDPSLIGTGLAVVNAAGETEYLGGWTNTRSIRARCPQHLGYYELEAPTWSGRLHRILFIVDWITKTIERWACSGYDVVVAVEGYAYSAQSVRATDLHELGGLIKSTLWERGLPFRIYNPTVVKMAWTGKGNAKKPDMIAAAEAHLGVNLRDYGIPVETAGNLADAACIAHLLRAEMDLKAGRVGPLDVPPTVAKVLEQVSTADPEPLVRRAFEARDEFTGPDGICPGA